MEGGVTIEKQENFPYLKEYQDKFPIDENTIFVYKDKIYTNNEMPYDVVHHELEHLRRMNKIGAKKWIENYLNDKDFRLKEELIAYKHQLKEVRKMNDRQEYAHILMESARNLSSKLYGEIVSYPVAIKLLK